MQTASARANTVLDFTPEEKTTKHASDNQLYVLKNTGKEKLSQ